MVAEFVPVIAVNAMRASSRARRAPRQWWTPWPKARWDAAGRVTSKVAAPALRAGSRPAAANDTSTCTPAGITVPAMVDIPTGQVVTNDPQVRTLLQQGPDAANEVSRLFDQIKPTLPVLLANLTTFGQVAVTYRPSLEQVLVLLPPLVM